MRTRRVARVTFTIVAFGFLAGLALLGIAWVLTPIPDSTQPLATAQGSVIYYRDGTSVLAKQGVNRKSVPLAKVPKHVRDAVIAIENRTFYEDQGISLKGTARAVWSTITGRQVQGGSTITQQLVRNYYSGLTQERSAVRKIKEILISLKVDRSKPKDWVLEQYLNTIYYGRGAYGIEAAAQAYFGRHVSELTVAQGAYLAGVIQQPSRFANPKGADLAAAKERWQAVVTAMVETGALDRRQAAGLRFPKLAKPRPPLSLGGQRGYMLAQVRAELNRRGYSDEMIDQGGLKVVTTFDKELMAAAEEAVRTVLPPSTPKQVRTGLAAVDPATGEVLAFYGGADYRKNQYDNAFSAKVQAGSTFKPYTLAAALEEGLGLDTRVTGTSSLRVASAAKPIENSGGVFYGSSIDLVTATRNSVNTAFVDLGQRIGADKTADAAQAAGIPAEQLAPHRGAATLPLGVVSVSAVQQASGFATFAAGGVHREAHVIRAITDASGKETVIEVPDERAFSPETAADTTYALTQVVQAGTGTAARLPDGRPVAGKTGTTDKSGAVWFVGYTPQLSTAVNMFRDDNKPVVVPGYGALYGGGLPAQIWRAFMTKAMAGKPIERFPEPTGYRSGYGGAGGGDDAAGREDEGSDAASPSPPPADEPPAVPETERTGAPEQTAPPLAPGPEEGGPPAGELPEDGGEGGPGASEPPDVFVEDEVIGR